MRLCGILFFFLFPLHSPDVSTRISFFLSAYKKFLRISPTFEKMTHKQRHFVTLSIFHKIPLFQY